MPTTSKDRANAENPSQGARLDSWKEIAAYLRRGERTVKRWETDRGLPVHRLPGGGRASVYAYTAELDEWLKSSEVPELVPTEDDGEEEEAEDTSAEVVIAGDNPLSGDRSSPKPLRIGSGPNRKWLLAFAGVLVAALTGAAVQLAALRSGNLRLSHAVFSFFSKSQPNSDPAGSRVVSDPEKSRARELYLKGRYEWNERTPDSLNRALDSFTQAIVHDPGYAQAYVGLADTYDLLREYSTMPESDAFQRAVAAARKAVELDDSLSEAHRALAFSEFWGTWDFADSEKEFHRAIELNPKDPVARRWYANSFAMPGRFAQCLEQINKAQELDPSSHATLADKGIMLFQSGRTSEGVELLKEVERTDPEFRSSHFYMMLISMYIRDYPAYLKEGEEAAKSTNDPMLRDNIASAQRGYSRAGGRGLLSELYASQKKYYAAGKLSGTILAKTCVMMGKKQEALQLLEEDYARHEPYMLTCLEQRDLLTLKDEPRYKALVKKINFPPVP
jgi:tetratricopeptide (TPR) repeat protein